MAPAALASSSLQEAPMGVMRRRMVRRRMKTSRVGKGREAPAWCYLGVDGQGGSWEWRGMSGGKVANTLVCRVWDAGWPLMGVGWSVVVWFVICQGSHFKQMCTYGQIGISVTFQMWYWVRVESVSSIYSKRFKT